MESNNKASYAMGVNIGINLANQLPIEDLNMDDVMAGIADSIKGEIKMPEQEIAQALQEFSAQQQAKEQARGAEAASEGEEFLKSNGQREEVSITESGLQYEILIKSDGDGAKPSAASSVTVHYHGALPDGTVFDSSVQRGEPITFALNQVIPGWTEGVQLMEEGDKFRFVIPSHLAYGEKGAGQSIGPNATLVFEVELLAVE